MTGIIEGGWSYVTAVYVLTWASLLLYTAWVGRRLAQAEATNAEGEST